MKKNSFGKVLVTCVIYSLFVLLILPDIALSSVIGTIEKITTTNSFSRANAISPDGKHLYVLVGGSNLGVTAALRSYQIDRATGKLTNIDEILYDATGANGIDGIHSGSDIAISPDGKHVYTIALGGNPSISRTINIFSRNASSGILTFESNVVSGADTGNFDYVNAKLTFSPDGFFLYVTASNPTELVVFQRSAVSGALSFVESFTGESALPVLPIEWLSNTYSSVVSPDGQNLYVVGHNGPTSGGDLIVFTRDNVAGSLMPLELHVSQIVDANGVVTREGISSMNQLESVAISNDGNNVYAVAWSSHTLLSFSRNSDGTLVFMDAQGYQDSTQNNPDIMFGPVSVKVSPNGRFVYVGSGIGKSIVVFLRDLTSGEVSPLGYAQGSSQDKFIDKLTDMEIDESGRFLYIISSGTSGDGITAFDLSADLSSSISTDPVNVTPGSNYRYVVHVDNNGASDASNINVVTTLPADVNFVSATTSVPGGTCSVTGTEVSCTMNKIITGSAEEVYIDVVAPDTSKTVTVLSAASADQVEANVTDNQASLSTNIADGQPSQSTGNTSDNSGSGLFDIWFAVLLALLFSLRDTSVVARCQSLFGYRRG